MNKLNITTLIIFQFSCLIMNAQNIDKVFASVQNKNIVVSYNIKNAQTEQAFNIELWYSADKAAYKKCQTISCSDGTDIGISAGYNKSITWIVLQDLNSLDCNTLDFEVRATVYPQKSDFTGISGTYTDSRDKHTYKWVRIGKQIIMAENLAYKPVNGNYWAYGDKQVNVAKYGYLYDWETAKNLCPTDWHLPAKEEFETLLQNFDDNNLNTYNALITGGYSGFMALLGGYHEVDGNFNYMGTYTSFWSSTLGGDGGAWYMYVGGSVAGAGLYDNGGLCGFYVRCFRD